MTHDIVTAGDFARANPSCIDIQGAAGAAAVAPISRRNLMNMMTKLAASTAFATVPTAGARATAPGASSDFPAKVAAFRRAMAEERAFDTQVYYPAIEALEEAQAAVPHETVGVEPHTGVERSTADWETVAMARSATRGRYSIDPRFPDVVATYAFHEQMKAAAERRDAKTREIHASSGIDALTGRSDALATASDSAFAAVLDHPVITAADLAEKLAVIELRGSQDREDMWAIVAADVRRIAARNA